MRLRRVSPASPGWTRRRSGRGFRYLDEAGRPLGAEEVARIRALVIPPAWQEVWICPHPRGHLQATGIDAAGRRQYLYHPAWRERRDEEKFARVAAAARLLPVWAPVLVLAGFLAIAVHLDLLPVGATLVLAGLLPLRVTPRPVA